MSKVEVSVDGGSYVLASGTSTWSSTVDTRAYADGAHTFRARVTDSSGYSATTSVGVDVRNATAPPPPGS